MAVKRIVPDFALSDPQAAKSFYEDILGLNVIMDLGWVVTFASDVPTTPQITIACEGRAGIQLPDVSIEVEDVDAVYERARSAGCEIVYELCDEEWGVRRFFLRDPSGKTLNILSHTN